MSAKKQLGFRLPEETIRLLKTLRLAISQKRGEIVSSVEVIGQALKALAKQEGIK